MTDETDWTGNLLLELTDASNWAEDEAELDVRPENVIVRHGGRELAVMMRTGFREWLIRPTNVYMVDEITWTTEPDGLNLWIRGRPYAVTTRSRRRLITHI